MRAAFLSTPETIIDKACNGQTVIPVDDEDRDGVTIGISAAGHASDTPVASQFA